MSADTHDGLIFSHNSDARVAASVTMAGILVVLLGGAFMAIGPQLKQDSSPGRNAARAPAAVRIIGTAPPASAPCEQQVWPNIDQRCLVRANLKATPDTTAAATRDNDKLSPLTAAVVDHPTPPQDDATTGSGVQEDTAVLRQSDAINATAPPNATSSADDDVHEMPPPRMVEPPRRHGPRHHGFPLHLHFGGFRF